VATTHIWTLGSLNLNDRVNTFLCTDHDPGAKATDFDEVRSYTGAIRQVDVHHPLVKMSMPMYVVGIGGDDADAADDLFDRLVVIKAAFVAGGAATYQPPGEPLQTFTIGRSSEPGYLHDYLYVTDHIAQLKTVDLWRLP